MGTKGYDCLEIPGAAKGTMCEDFAATRLNANVFCGDSAGLATVMMAERGANSGTICSELYLQLYNLFKTFPLFLLSCAPLKLYNPSFQQSQILFPSGSLRTILSLSQR